MAELAAKVGASRSIVAERFMHFVGEPPLTYLARWRLQLAARLLQTTQKTVLHVAFDVGYESEAAFKREFGLPPAQYRRKSAGNGSTTSADELHRIGPDRVASSRAALTPVNPGDHGSRGESGRAFDRSLAASDRSRGQGSP